MASQDLDLAAAARVAVEGARYRGRYGTDADSLATPQPDPRATRCASSSSALEKKLRAAHVSQQWQVKS